MRVIVQIAARWTRRPSKEYTSDHADTFNTPRVQQTTTTHLPLSRKIRPGHQVCNPWVHFDTRIFARPITVYNGFAEFIANSAAPHRYPRFNYGDSRVRSIIALPADTGPRIESFCRSCPRCTSNIIGAFIFLASSGMWVHNLPPPPGVDPKVDAFWLTMVVHLSIATFGVSIFLDSLPAACKMLSWTIRCTRGRISELDGDDKWTERGICVKVYFYFEIVEVR